MQVLARSDAIIVHGPFVEVALKPFMTAAVLLRWPRREQGLYVFYVGTRREYHLHVWPRDWRSLLVLQQLASADFNVEKTFSHTILRTHVLYRWARSKCTMKLPRLPTSPLLGPSG